MILVRFILSVPKYIVLGLIRVYQFLFSFDHAFWAKWVNMRVCIYHPSCSEYTYQAIEKFGLIKGGLMGGARILRCNGINPGGSDPVPDKFSLKRNSGGV